VSHEMYRRMVPQPAGTLEPCPVCGSKAVVLEFSEEPTDPVQRVVMCENGERFGPQDGIRNDGCLLYMPPEQFYHGRGADAARYWNEYAKALTAQRRKRSWERHSALREEPRP
jgi:hypothetical protein